MQTYIIPITSLRQHQLSHFLYVYNVGPRHLLHSKHLCVIIFITVSKGVTNMQDTLLLDGTEPISKEALQAFFQANDFSTIELSIAKSRCLHEIPFYFPFFEHLLKYVCSTPLIATAKQRAPCKKQGARVGLSNKLPPLMR